MDDGMGGLARKQHDLEFAEDPVRVEAQNPERINVRPAVFGSAAAEWGFCTSIVLSQIMAVSRAPPGAFIGKNLSGFENVGVLHIGLQCGRTRHCRRTANTASLVHLAG